MMAASLALPLALFVFASIVSWVSVNETADREIERTLDVAHEHALKVFETIDRSLSEISEIIRGIPDEGIRSREEALHQRLARLTASLPQVKSTWIFDARGRALANSLVSPPPDLITVTSPADGIERRVGYHRLAEYPVYVSAGLETSAIRARWFSTMSQHLIFGLPATALLFLFLALALRRTQNLHAEAARREDAEEAL